ncbi:MAG TPA: methylenetetrahydrofolate reductase [Burkholderiales bacterium]|nr:methylenetetrahydrofolate reductase [Burkholderiales bacterium]
MSAAELIAASSLEISPRELHRAADVAALLPKDSCIYVPSLPGLPLARTLDAIAAIRAAGLDPVPHVAARRIADRAAFADFLAHAVADYGVHRVLLLGGDEPKPRGPYQDSLQLLDEGVLAKAGVKEVGIAGYPEGHVRIAAPQIEAALARKIKLTREQGLGVYLVTQFSFAPARVVEYCAEMARAWPALPIYVGMAGPTDPAALARYAQRCGVSASFRALRNLGTGIARLVTHDNPDEHFAAIARYCAGRDSCNVVGVHLYSFGGAVRTAAWMKDKLDRP